MQQLGSLVVFFIEMSPCQFSSYQLSLGLASELLAVSFLRTLDSPPRCAHSCGIGVHTVQESLQCTLASKVFCCSQQRSHDRISVREQHQPFPSRKQKVGGWCAQHHTAHHKPSTAGPWLSRSLLITHLSTGVHFPAILCSCDAAV